MILIPQPRFSWLLLWVVIFFGIDYIRGIETKWWRIRDIAAATLILTIILVPFYFWSASNLNGLLLLLIIFFVIYYIRGIETKWWRIRDIGAVTLILTIILVPFSFWGTYSLNGIENDGLYEVGSDSFSLGPNETYTSETLSNLYSITFRSLRIYTDGRNYTFYICDGNLPEVRYFLQNILENEVDYWGDPFEFDWIVLSVPYHYSGFNMVANWTMNFYNPSQNESIDVTYYMEHSGAIFPSIDIRSSFAYYRYQEPAIALVYLWIVAGFVTLLVHIDRDRKQRTAILEKEDNLEAQDSEPHEEINGYQR